MTLPGRFSTYTAIALAVMAAGCRKAPQAPERLPQDELPAYREAMQKLRPYIVLEDSVFSITLSEQAAADIGVPSEYYNRAKKDIDYTNYLIETHNREGQPIDITDSFR